MKHIIPLAFLFGLGALGGCATNDSLENLPPMPAAKPSVDDLKLGNGMDEPAPVAVSYTHLTLPTKCSV